MKPSESADHIIECVSNAIHQIRPLPPEAVFHPGRWALCGRTDAHGYWKFRQSWSQCREIVQLSPEPRQNHKDFFMILRETDSRKNCSFSFSVTGQPLMERPLRTQITLWIERKKRMKDNLPILTIESFAFPQFALHLSDAHTTYSRSMKVKESDWKLSLVLMPYAVRFLRPY